MNKEAIQDRLKRTIDELKTGFERKFDATDGSAYALGYMESFMADVLTAYVPANMRHQLLEMFDKRIADIMKQHSTGDDHE
jgi:hypothetical protein